MNSIGKDCTELKRAYDECFNNWFAEKFLKGQTEEACSPLFKVYQDCVKKAIEAEKIEVWEIDKDVLDSDTKDQKDKK